MILKGEYHNTSLAQHGDQGSKLPEFPTGTTWKAGGTAEVNLISVLKLFLSNMSFCSVITEYETTSRTPVLTSLPKLTSALSLSWRSIIHRHQYQYCRPWILLLQAIWQITANHGGGYQYRLCPAGEDPVRTVLFLSLCLYCTEKINTESQYNVDDLADQNTEMI